jgi:FkbM family methyltransferase
MNAHSITNTFFAGGAHLLACSSWIWLLVPTAVGLVWLSHKKRKATYDSFASFTRFAKNIIWLSLHGNSFGRWAMFLTYVRIELTRAIVHGLRLSRSSEMVWGQRLSFLNYDVFAILFEEIYLPNIYSFRCAHSQPHIIDCGANIGAATAYFLTQHPDAIITAFEPDEATFRFLERNANQNGWKRVTLHQAALHRTEESMTFFSRPTAPLASGFRESISSSEARATNLQTVRLSSYIWRPVDLLKLDVEGAELGIMEDLVESGKLSFVDQIIMEYHHHIEPDEDHLGQFLSLLEQNGFGYELQAPLNLPFPTGRQHNFMMYAYRKASEMGDSRVSPVVRVPFSAPVTVAA